MKKLNLLTATIICCLMLTSAIFVPANAVQPPIDVSTYWVGTIGQPRRVDPARAYDTASAELIFNVYEPLIFFDDVKLMPDTTADVSVVGSSDLGKFRPVLATALPTRSYDAVTHITSYTFEIDTTTNWQPWTANNGTVYNQQVRITDVEYTFKRMLVQDMVGAPSWMICKPFCGLMYFSDIDGNPATNTLEPVGVDGSGERLAQSLIEAAIQVVDATHVKLTMLPDAAWPVAVMYQIFSHTVSCIVNKDFCIEHGCWDGSFADGWSTRYRQKPSNSNTPLDSYYSSYSRYTFYGTQSVPAMCGTGPYMVDSGPPSAFWDKATATWRADYWPTYRGGWNMPGTAKRSLQHIIVKGIAEWPTRKMGFLAGDFDSVDVPRAKTRDLINGTTGITTPLDGITLYYNAPELSIDMASFVFQLDAATPYPPRLGGAVKLDFFDDIHMRTAFCHTINFSTVYVPTSWESEAVHPASWWVKGIYPASAENLTLTPHDINLALTTAELKLAAGNPWNLGFDVTLIYNLGNIQRRLACELMRDNIESLNALRPGLPPFVVHIVGLDWPVFLDYIEYRYTPMFFIGMQLDFHHADDVVRAFMHSQGHFAYSQGYSDAHVDELIDAAIIEPNPAVSDAMYQELQYIFWRDNPSLPLIQAVGRRWQRDWVRGWYYNQLYPGNYFYDLWKTIAAPALPVDIDATGSISPVGGTVIKITPQSWLMTPLEVTFDVTAIDMGAMAAVYVTMALNRTNIATGYSQIIPLCDAQVVLTVAAPNWEEVFLWNESSQAGAYASTLTAGNYTLSGIVFVITSTAYDSNLLNNRVVAAGGDIIVVVLTGDVNNDGIIDMADISMCIDTFMADPESPFWDAKCDVNGDDSIDMADISFLIDHFFEAL